MYFAENSKNREINMSAGVYKIMSLDEINIVSEDQFTNVSTITNSTSGDDTFK